MEQCPSTPLPPSWCHQTLMNGHGGRECIYKAHAQTVARGREDNGAEEVEERCLMRVWRLEGDLGETADRTGSSGQEGTMSVLYLCILLQLQNPFHYREDGWREEDEIL